MKILHSSKEIVQLTRLSKKNDKDSSYNIELIYKKRYDFTRIFFSINIFYLKILYSYSLNVKSEYLNIMFLSLSRL